MATSVLIIEDEPIIALDIESMVRELGHEVTGVARTHREAVEMVKARPPGLVLADIQLADGSSGLEAVNEILTTLDTPVIFITAFPERLLTGEKPEPAFLVTKPFRPETVKATISQALFFDRKAGRKHCVIRRRARSRRRARCTSSATTLRNVSKLKGFGSVGASSNSASARSGAWPVAKAKGIAWARSARDLVALVGAEADVQDRRVHRLLRQRQRRLQIVRGSDRLMAEDPPARSCASEGDQRS